MLTDLQKFWMTEYKKSGSREEAHKKMCLGFFWNFYADRSDHDTVRMVLRRYSVTKGWQLDAFTESFWGNKKLKSYYRTRTADIIDDDWEINSIHPQVGELFKPFFRIIEEGAIVTVPSLTALNAELPTDRKITAELLQEAWAKAVKARADPSA